VKTFSILAPFKACTRRKKIHASYDTVSEDLG